MHYRSLPYVQYARETVTGSRICCHSLLNTGVNFMHFVQQHNSKSSQQCVRHMSDPTVYGGLCALAAAGRLFQFLFEICSNNNIQYLEEEKTTR